MNTIAKYVASRTLTEVKWNATLLGGDVVDAARRLKEEPGGDILKVGTGGSTEEAVEPAPVGSLNLKGFARRVVAYELVRSRVG
jgi:hypothetical protein